MIAVDLMAPSTVDSIEPAGPGTVRFDWLMSEPPATAEQALAVRRKAERSPALASPPAASGIARSTWRSEPGAPVMNCRNIPVEVHEINNPVRIQRLEFIQDSAGAGQFRGGSGLRKDIELLANEATLTLLGDRHLHRPYGLFGKKIIERV